MAPTLLQIPNSAFSGLPPYLGGKRKLVPLIFSALAGAIPPTTWPALNFLDPFVGGGSVSLAAKFYGFDVAAGDIAERSLVVARALIANSRTKILPADITRLLRGLRPADDHGTGGLESPFADLLVRSESFTEPLRSLLNLAIINSYLRIFPMSLPSASDSRHVVARDWDRISSRRLGHYLRALNRPLEMTLQTAALAVNRSVIGGRGNVVAGNALDTIADSNADIAYVDPPYPGTSGYDAKYRPLDELLGDDRPPESAPALDELFEASAEIRTVVFSYGGPTVTIESLVTGIERHRPVTSAMAVPYRHLKSIAKEGTNEYIIVCSDR